MNKEEFIKELVTLYDDFTDKNTEPRIKAYRKVLPETLKENTSYDTFFKTVLEAHDSFRFAPSPAKLSELLPREYNPML